ncbi:hypothetical protein BJV78DRAFT_1333782 [Lactifluus subvellereus]|nr:hypothetical protein BJV78DRAFT_1333782 [Lactifluus subvellereus]
MLPASQQLHLASPHYAALLQADDLGDDSNGTEIAAGSSNNGSRAPARAAALLMRGKQAVQQLQLPRRQRHTDDAGAHDAFIAGMIYALSRRPLPGMLYTLGLADAMEALAIRGFATELAGRKAHRRAWGGPGEEMARAVWFDG